jgi:hypothetical protein
MGVVGMAMAMVMETMATGIVVIMIWGVVPAIGNEAKEPGKSLTKLFRPYLPSIIINYAGYVI